jgi:drug/metabolite transporter (DMT)-like permease
MSQSPPQSSNRLTFSSADNLSGSLFMIGSMALFTIEDAIIKHLALDLPVSQILILFGLGGLVIFSLLTKLRGERIFTPALREPTLLIRSGFEVFGRLFFILAIAYSAFSTTSAILQATPLLVTAAGVFLFKERVSALRWSLIVLGFMGVLMVVRPGSDAFNATSILAVCGMIGFAGRDLGTRAAPKGLSFAQLGVYGFAALAVSGVLLLIWRGDLQPLSLTHWLWISLLWAIGVTAYTTLTLAMRTGELSVVTPFRYSRLLFAMAFAALIFKERPAPLELIGAMVIVVAGLLLMVTAKSRRKL